jgi:hypothetical protein
MRNVGSALHRVRFDERRPRGIPGFERAAAIRVARFQPVTKHPGYFDRFRVWTDHAAACRGRFAQPKQEAVVDISQAEARSLAAAVFMKILKVGTP